jgi:hypothetical protein
MVVDVETLRENMGTNVMPDSIHYVVNIEISKVTKHTPQTSMDAKGRDVEQEVHIVTTEKLRTVALKKAIKYLQIEETE